MFFEGCLIVVGVFHGAFGKFEFCARHFLVGKKLQKIMNAVEAGAFFIVGTQNIPGSPIGVGRFQHRVARAGVFKPLGAGGQIRRAQFPLAEGIGDARFEAALLFGVAHFQPEFDERDVAPDDVFFDFRTAFQEKFVLVLRAKAHHVLDAGAIIPAAIENNDFTRRGKMRHVTLQINLSLFTVGRCWQRDNAKDARADAFSDGADGAALACTVAAFKENDDAEAFVFYPFLKFAEFGLKASQFLFILFAFQFFRPVGIRVLFHFILF